MTPEMMNLHSLVEKTPDADVLREMIAFAAERSARPSPSQPTDEAHRRYDRNW
jgi:hypothetical protein